MRSANGWLSRYKVNFQIRDNGALPAYVSLSGQRCNHCGKKS